MKKSVSERMFSVFNIVLMLLLCIVMIYPYLNQLAISLNDGMDTSMGGITIFPRVFTLESYAGIFKNRDFGIAAGVSVLRTIFSVVLSVALVFSAAYGLTRQGLPYKRGITLFLMIPAYISAGMIPIYIAYRYLGLINSFWAYVLPNAFVFYNMVIFRSFIQSIPVSLEESAKIDGANDFVIMSKIVFPLSMPAIATVALWVAVWNWNDWTTTLMYVTDKKIFTLQYLMMKLVKESELAQRMALESAMSGRDVSVGITSESIKSASLIVTTLPIVLVYPFLQKYFIKGVALGAVKE